MFHRCSACPTNEDGRPCSNPVLPDLPPGDRCGVLFLGAGPAKVENKTGTPYSGLAGEELNDTYLPIAGLQRDQVGVANVSSCWDGSDRTPNEKRVLACAH